MMKMTTFLSCRLVTTHALVWTSPCRTLRNLHRPLWTTETVPAAIKCKPPSIAGTLPRTTFATSLARARLFKPVAHIYQKQQNSQESRCDPISRDACQACQAILNRMAPKGGYRTVVACPHFQDPRMLPS